MKQLFSENPHSISKRHGLILVGGLVLAGVALLIAAALLLMARPVQTDGVMPPRVGLRMGDMVFTSPDGGKVRLADFKDRPVIINIWATWCPPCRDEMPVLNAYYLAHQAEGLALLAVNAGEDAQTALDFSIEYELAFPIFLDEQYTLVDAMGINNYPTSIVIGRDGVVKYIHVGSITQNVLEKRVTPLLK